MTVLDIALAALALGTCFSVVRAMLSLSDVFDATASLIRARSGAVDEIAAGEARVKTARAEMPDTLRRWIEAESEEFAQEELTAEAAELYEKKGSWAVAEETMRRRHERDTMPPELAREEAWRGAGEAAVEVVRTQGGGVGWDQGPRLHAVDDDDSLEM